MSADQFNKSAATQIARTGRVVQNDELGRIEFYDRDDHLYMIQGDLGNDANGYPVYGTALIDAAGLMNVLSPAFQVDGFGSGQNLGVKVAQLGKDARTAGDDELIMSSEFNNFKIVGSGSGSLTINDPAIGGGYFLLATINHNLGYKPTVFAFGNLEPAAGDGLSPICHNAPAILQSATISAQILWTARAVWYIIVTSTQLIIGIYDITNDGLYNGDVMNYKYYLCRETSRA